MKRFGSLCLLVLLLCSTFPGVTLHVGAQTPQATPDASSPPTTPVDQLILRIVEGNGYEYMTDSSGNPANDEYQLVTDGEIAEEVLAAFRPRFSGIQNHYVTEFNLVPEGQDSGPQPVTATWVRLRVNTFSDAEAAADYVVNAEDALIQQAQDDPEAPQDITPIPDLPDHDQALAGVTGTVMFHDVTTGEPGSAEPFTILIAQEGAVAASVWVAGPDPAFNDAVARALLPTQLACIAADVPCEPIPLPAVNVEDTATPGATPAT